MNEGRRGISHAEANSGETLSLSRAVACAPVSGSAARSNSAKARPVAAASARPAAVTCTAQCLRLKSGPPTIISRLRMRWLIADGVRCNADAASLKLCRRTAASNACSDKSNVGLSLLAAGDESAARNRRGGEAADREAIAETL